uniref:non-specific serine/threonine protein kinase n=1 Tax=Lactuca sativa TaxID=4236 RepID=A0A9R1W8J0_LACSA|nr:hypothetical protein LSAT_V11C300125390 [Lactuca sativa]
MNLLQLFLDRTTAALNATCLVGSSLPTIALTLTIKQSLKFLPKHLAKHRFTNANESGIDLLNILFLFRLETTILDPNISILKCRFPKFIFPLIGAVLLGLFMYDLIAYRQQKKMYPYKSLDEERRDYFSVRSFDGVIVYDDILKAMNDFDEANSIRTGGYGIGSLGSILRSDVLDKELDWLKRLMVLAYINHDSSPPMIHRDISIANILLESDCEAHIYDLGTSKLLNLESACLYDGRNREIFGIVALELIMGKQPGELPTLQTNYLVRIPIPSPEVEIQVKLVLSLSRACLNSNPKERPTMPQVSNRVQNLEKSPSIVANIQQIIMAISALSKHSDLVAISDGFNNQEKEGRRLCVSDEKSKREL